MGPSAHRRPAASMPASRSQPLPSKTSQPVTVTRIAYSPYQVLPASPRRPPPSSLQRTEARATGTPTVVPHVHLGSRFDGRCRAILGRLPLHARTLLALPAPCAVPARTAAGPTRTLSSYTERPRAQSIFSRVRAPYRVTLLLLSAGVLAQSGRATRPPSTTLIQSSRSLPVRNVAPGSTVLVVLHHV